MGSLLAPSRLRGLATGISALTIAAVIGLPAATALVNPAGPASAARHAPAADKRLARAGQSGDLRQLPLLAPDGPIGEAVAAGLDLDDHDRVEQLTIEVATAAGIGPAWQEALESRGDLEAIGTTVEEAPVSLPLPGAR